MTLMSRGTPRGGRALAFDDARLRCVSYSGILARTAVPYLLLSHIRSLTLSLEHARHAARCAPSVAFTVIEADLEAFSPGRVAAHDGVLHESYARRPPMRKRRRCRGQSNVRTLRSSVMSRSCLDVHMLDHITYKVHHGCLTVNGTFRAAARFCSARRCPRPRPPEGQVGFM